MKIVFLFCNAGNRRARLGHGNRLGIGRNDGVPVSQSAGVFQYKQLRQAGRHPGIRFTLGDENTVIRAIHQNQRFAIVDILQGSVIFKPDRCGNTDSSKGDQKKQSQTNRMAAA